jgi:hypothetical protein
MRERRPSEPLGRGLRHYRKNGTFIQHEWGFVSLVWKEIPGMPDGLWHNELAPFIVVIGFMRVGEINP